MEKVKKGKGKKSNKLTLVIILVCLFLVLCSCSGLCLAVILKPNLINLISDYKGPVFNSTGEEEEDPFD